MFIKYTTIKEPVPGTKIVRDNMVKLYHVFKDRELIGMDLTLREADRLLRETLAANNR